MADSDTSYTIETEQQLWDGACCPPSLVLLRPRRKACILGTIQISWIRQTDMG